jgi:DNA repair exonuclease SbcCD nuclease subunit
MKNFVVFSDLHLHQWQYGSRLIDGRNSRLEQQKEVVQSIVRYCTEKDIPQCVFTGDLFHTSTVTAEVAQAAHEAFKGFKENGIELTILVGNHDQSSRTGGSHACSWLSDHGQLIDTGVGTTTVQTIGGLDSYFFPYTGDEGVLRGWLSSIGEGRSFCFFHQGVGGVEVNSKGFTLNEILTPALIPGNCAMAFSGHYHSFKPVTSNLIIPGSTVQLNWGDEGEPRGWLDVTVDGEQVTEVNLIQSQASKFITLNEQDFDSNGANNPLPSLVGNYIRVLSSGAYSPEELSNLVLQFGAASCEVKTVYKENPAFKTTATVASLNEVIYSFAKAKEKAGIISEYDSGIGERLLKGNYCVPQI